MNNVEKIKPTGLFTNYIYKAIPLAFDESMSYYETLCGLLSYLKETVIPTVNNNADAIIEVQNLMKELQNYIDNYFNNLDVQQEINNKLDEMVESGQLEDIIANYLKSVNNCYIAPLTKQDKYTHDNQAYLGISFDGQCFTPIPQTKGFCNVHTDIQMFKYNDYYLFACTTGASSQNPNIDAYVGWTKNFIDYHFENVSLGFTQYRDTNYPDASDDRRRWTPRFYLDKENNLNMLVSMATDNTLAYDKYNIQQRTQMKVFHQTVTFTENDTNFLTGNGDINVFKIHENGENVDTFFDCDLIVKDNVYYLIYKNAYYNDVCIAISTTDDYSIFNTTKTSIFENPYTEAPCVVKSNDGYLIYGQQYEISRFNIGSRNLALFTKDFNEFINVGFPKRLYADYKIDGIMRNLSPVLIEDKALVTKFKTMVDTIGYGCYDNNELKTIYYNNNLLQIIKMLNDEDRKVSLFNNSWVSCNETIENVEINNLYDANDIVIYGTIDNLDAYTVSLKYKDSSDRIVMGCGYPSAMFKITNDFIRCPQRSFIPNVYKTINNSTSDITNETIILPNSRYAKVHIFNKNKNISYSKNTNICNVGLKNQQNGYIVYGVVTYSTNPDFKEGTIIPLTLTGNGDLQSLIDIPGCEWKTDFIYLLQSNFWNV